MRWFQQEMGKSWENNDHSIGEMLSNEQLNSHHLDYLCPTMNGGHGGTLFRQKLDVMTVWFPGFKPQAAMRSSTRSILPSSEQPKEIHEI
jgi:hypothetical protein